MVNAIKRDNSYGFETIEKLNPAATTGIVIVIGHVNADDDYSISKSDLKKSIDNYSAQNVLLIDFAESQINLNDLGKVIKDFSAENEQVSVISGLHGFHVLSINNAHEIQIQPHYELTGYNLLDLALNYFALSARIKSADYFKMIADSTEGKLTSVWQTSCQGNQMVKELEGVLPDGVTVYTESDGYTVKPSAVHDSLQHLLTHNLSIDFDGLLFLEFNKLTDLGCYGDLCYNYNPKITIIGGEQTSYNKLADNFIANLNDSHAESSGEFFKAVNDIQKSLETYTVCHPARMQSLLTAKANSSDYIKSENCLLNHGVNSYLYESLFGEDYWSPQAELENCQLSTYEYSLALSCVALLGTEHPMVASSSDVIAT